MKKNILAVALFSVVLIGGYMVVSAVAQGGQPVGQGQMEHGNMEKMGPGMGMMGEQGDMGMMMGPGMGMMGRGMMGQMMSPELMGTMMAIHGDMMSMMGQMMQKYGSQMEQMTPDLQQKMRGEMMDRMGQILTKHGAALRDRAKAMGK